MFLLFMFEIYKYKNLREEGQGEKYFRLNFEVKKKIWFFF